MIRLAILLSCFLWGSLVQAASVTPLVDVTWIKANGVGDGRVIVDLRGKRAWLGGHIPGAVNTDYGRDGWRVRHKGVAGLFPPNEKSLHRLTTAIGKLGIDNSSHVILVAPGYGAGDMGIATRIYWTFKVLGHDRVSILDGGMSAYLYERVADNGTPLNPLQPGPVPVAAKKFVARVRHDMLIGRSEVESALSRGIDVLDARPNAQYIGLHKSGQVRRAGTLPGAKSVPGEWLTDNGGGVFRKKSALAQLFDIAGSQRHQELFAFCNTGHWSSLTWFAASEILGNKKARMYDGSLADWTMKPGAPVEQKIKLN
jgi:thiosulfate/3-mercaptopyruvate sulfurtransferase